MEAASPYMLMVANLRKEHCLELEDSQLTGLDKLQQIRSSVPAITHVDNSARVQTVHKTTNPKFHRLITEFKRLTGVGMVINTSFNVRGEPPVCSPDDAIRCFLATDMDVLVMQNVVLLKTEQPNEQIQAAKNITFDKD
jgi:carbamoyltransferase